MIAVSFRGRMAMAMSVLILAIAAVVSIYLPQRFERDAIALITHKAETLANLTAFTIHPAIYFNDRAALEEALSGTRQDADVDYIVVTDTAGRTLSAHRASRARGAALSRRVAGGGVSADGKRYDVMVPIREDGRDLARLYLGVSLERVHRAIVQMRIGILVLSAVILAAGVAAVLLISNVMTRPLRHLAAAAQRLAAGEMTHRVTVERNDELGSLAESFNDMAARIAERDASLRQLSRRLLAVQEQERVRIAREVHDELGQALTSMKIDLQQIGRDQPSLDEALRPIGRTIDEIVDLVRRIATDLRPAILDDLGVKAALEQQLRRVRESSGLRTRLAVSEDPQVDLLTGVTLYRIAQEALTNVVRHAEASEVSVRLDVDSGAALLEIRDNGRGVTDEQVHGAQSLGLLGIRERAEMLGGTVTIDGRPGEGTVVRVTLPLAKDGRSIADPVR